MEILCMMPTYGRPAALIETSIALFEQQTHPGRRLVIFDDLGTLPEQTGDRWHVIRTSIRQPSLPAKYSVILIAAEMYGWEWDAVAVWDDDDVYLPWHLASHAEALARSGWSQPSEVWGLIAGEPRRESSRGRFHGSIAIGRDLLNQVGRWEDVLTGQGLDTRRADFDQRMIGALEQAVGAPGDSLATDAAAGRPSYVYGWGRGQHCSGLMESPDNVTWYARHAESAATEAVEKLRPRLDSQAAHLCETLKG